MEVLSKSQEQLPLQNNVNDTRRNHRRHEGTNLRPGQGKWPNILHQPVVT